jgi:catechol 2,3-dioxygenase-like lactoylglutathione lyase family enzyme
LNKAGRRRIANPSISRARTARLGPDEGISWRSRGHGRMYVPKMNDFYRNVMGLAAEPSLNAARITNQGYSGETAFATDGHVQVHMSERDLALGFRQKQFVNPLERGHIAFRTDDIAAFKKRLDEKGVPYSDYGTWAMNGWHQIFFHDPDGNVVEVHQVNE